MADLSAAASGKPNIRAILTIGLAEFQQLNFDRIFPNLEENGVLDKEVVNVMKSRATSEKSSVLKAILEATEDENDFETFLKVVANEDKNSSFYKPTKEFLDMVGDSRSAGDYSDIKKKSFQPSEGSL